MPKPTEVGGWGVAASRSRPARPARLHAPAHARASRPRDRGCAGAPWAGIYILVVVGVCGFVGGGLVCLVGVFWWGVGIHGGGGW